MMSISRRAALTGIALLALGACSEPQLAGLDDLTQVTVFNDSHVRVTNVQITTAEGSQFTVASLEPGATSATQTVAALHESPIVSLSAEGKSFIAHPVEGFAGFNSRLPSGSYVIKIQPLVAEQVVRVSVSQIVEQLR